MMALVWRVATGDGQQLENLAMSDDEWRGELARRPLDEDHVEVSVRVEDWLSLVRLARQVQR